MLNPATLELSGWWKSAFTASPWVGTASAGDSGGRNVSGLSAPTSTSLLGIATADFNGVDDELASALAISSYMAADDFGIVLLARVDAAAADPGAALRYQGRVALSDSAAQGYLHLGFNTSGFFASIYDGSYKSNLSAAAGVGGTPVDAWGVYWASFTGGSLKTAVNADALSAGTAVTNIDVVDGVLTMGSGFGSALYDGALREVMIMSAATLATSKADLYAYFQATYSSAGLP